MGEYAEYAWQREMCRGIKSKFWDGKPRPRNPIAAYCPHCGKGIRPIAGRISKSMAAHIKDKGCNVKSV